LEADLHVRTRRPGDKFIPLGMDNSKKLKDFMIDSKIPFHHRDRIPLVCTKAGIIWVVGWRISNWAKLKETNKQAIQINFSAK
jgi:tRNA(Ile)-lysidine synthase